MITPCHPLVYPYAIQAKPLTKMTQAPKNPDRVLRKTKPVRCVETGKVYSSREKAGEWAGCTGATITRAVLNGTQACGYNWVNK